MAFYSICLRRLLSPLLHGNLHHRLHDASYRRISTLVSSNPCLSSATGYGYGYDDARIHIKRRPFSDSSHLLQWFRFTGSLPSQSKYKSHAKRKFGLFRVPSDLKYGKILRDGSIYYEFDNNHWIVGIRFPEDAQTTLEQRIEIYVATAAKVFGSVEEAKKRIYSYKHWRSTNDFLFCVECSRETSNKFKGLPGVHRVWSDYSYRKPELEKRKRTAELKKRRKRIAQLKKLKGIPQLKKRQKQIALLKKGMKQQN